MNVRRLIEWIAVLVGAINCIYVPAEISQWDFPFPALYFIEIILAGLLVTVFVAWRPRFGDRWYAVPWIAAGITLAFVVLGGFSIGFFLIPALIAFLVIGMMADLQTGRSMVGHLVAAVVAAVAQGTFMVLASNFF